MHSWRSLIEVWCIIEQFVVYMQIASTGAADSVKNCCKFHATSIFCKTARSRHCRNSSAATFDDRGIRHCAIPICRIIVLKQCLHAEYRIRRSDPRLNFLLMVPRRFHTEVLKFFHGDITSASALSLLFFYEQMRINLLLARRQVHLQHKPTIHTMKPDIAPAFSYTFAPQEFFDANV